MKLLLCLFFMMLAQLGLSQVDLTASGGTLNATYTTLKAACDAVNAGTHTGVITMNITANTTEVAQIGAASVVLNASGSGAASYTSITISPTGGAARTISGGATVGFPLLNINGADNVTIDGLNSGGNALSIINTMASAVTGTCTIQFINDATNNTINRCTVLGGGLMTGFRNGATIFFSTGPTTGNDGNTISNCDIGPLNSSDLQSKGVCSIGSTTTAARNNSGNTVTNCNIYDYFIPDFESVGILLREGSTDWTVTNNKFFQTAARTHTSAGASHAAIRLQSSSFVNCTVSGNTIGFANSAGTGTYSLTGVATSKFYAIDQAAFGSTTASSIQNNVISNISFSGPMAGTNSSAPFVGIRIFEGKANIGTTLGNTIGSSTTAGTVAFTTSSGSASDVFAIHYNGGIENSISNNNIGGITATNSSNGTLNFYGILSKGGAAITSTIQSNMVGFSNAPISLTATTGAGLLIGILDSVGAASITSNTISSLTAYSSSPIVTGIKVNNTGSTAGNNIALNNVNELASRNAGQVYGIIYNGAATGTHQVQKNLVHSLAATAGGTIYGIGIASGLVKVYNNKIRLGLNAGGDVIGGARLAFIGAHVTADLAFTGLRDNSTNNNEFYFNSVYVGGEGVGGTSNTYAFYHTDAASTRVIQNNIFMNVRSNGAGTGKHYAVRVGGSGASPAGLTLNYNNYHVSGTGGVLGIYNGSDVTSMTNWKKTDGLAGSGPGLDGNSFSDDPAFVFPMGTIPNLHVNAGGTPVEGRGINIASITDDFDQEVRATLTPVDIGADASNAVATVLPVSFLSFSGQKVDNGNLLQWKTANESNNTGFDIQHSINGIDFNQIAFVPTKALNGNSSDLLSYQFLDPGKRGIINYYRLRQIDADGKSSFSQVIVIKNVPQKGITIKGLYPNPAATQSFLQIESDQPRPIVLIIFDMLGREVLRQNISIDGGYQIIALQLSHLASGRYSLHLKGTELNSVIPLIRK